MIGGLQGDLGDLDNKYLKQNILKYLKISIKNIKKLQENTTAVHTERKTLRVSAIRGSGYVWPEKLKRPSLPSGCETSECEMLADGIPPRVDWAMPQGGPSGRARCRNPSPGWHGARKAIRINSIRIPQEDTRRHAIRHSWTSHSGWYHILSGYVIRIIDYSEQALLQPTFRRSPMVCLDALSGHLCHGFQKTLLNLGLLWWSKSYQNTKT